MKCTNATKVNRKSGVAQWRNLQFRGPLLEMFLDRSVEVCGFFSGSHADTSGRPFPRTLL
jgi:hypothetical protein